MLPQLTFVKTRKSHTLDPHGVINSTIDEIKLKEPLTGSALARRHPHGHIRALLIPNNFLTRMVSSNNTYYSEERTLDGMSKIT